MNLNELRQYSEESARVIREGGTGWIWPVCHGANEIVGLYSAQGWCQLPACLDRRARARDAREPVSPEMLMVAWSGLDA